MKSKDPWIQVKALISYWFHLLNPLPVSKGSRQKKKKKKKLTKGFSGPPTFLAEEGGEAAAQDLKDESRSV